jgi:hypothetical protein
MADSQPHEMQLVRTHSSGAEEWFCPTCGRRFLMHWPPSYKKIILETGDEYAAHVGGKGGARLAARVDTPFEQEHGEEAEPFAPRHHMAPISGNMRPLPFEEVGAVPITDELRPWLRWMSSCGLADTSGAA